MSDNVVHIAPEGDKVTILHGNVDVHQFQGTKYQLDSVASVIELVRWKGSKEKTVIFYDDQGIRVILDDTILDRPQDRATYGFKFADSFLEWRKILDSSLSQKKFVDFLKRRPFDESLVVEPLLAQVQNLKLMTQIVGDYTYDDNNNITFMFKTKDGEGMTKLPTVITISLVVLNESDYSQNIEFELELRKPKSEDEKPLFIISCPKLQRYIKEAVEHEVGIMKEALKGYLIMAGNTGR